jgi:hypothetical protein
LALKWGQDLALELVLEYGLTLALVLEWGLELVLTLKWRLELVLGLEYWLKSKLDWRQAFGVSVGVVVLERELELVRGLELVLAWS